MLSSINNSEIDIDSTYTKYGQCRCCMARGQHRDLDKEYYYNNIKEVYRDIFAKCYLNLSLSQHNLISTLICENCVHRLRDASSFRMMVAASEELLLKTVIFKSDAENDTDVVDVRQNFTIDVKIENNLDIIRMIPSPDVFQDESKSPTENEQVHDKGWVNDNEGTNDGVPLKDKQQTNDVPLNYKERTNDDVSLNDKEGTNDDVPLKDKEQTNDDVRVNEKELVNDEERMNDDDGWSDDFDDRMSDDDGWSDVFDDPTNDDVPQNGKERTKDDVPFNDLKRTNDVPLNDKERTSDDVSQNDKERTSDDVPQNDKERTKDDIPLKDKERTSDDITLKNKKRPNDDVRVNDEERTNDDDGWSDDFDDRMNDDDGWGDDFDDPMNDDIQINDNERTDGDVPRNDKDRVNGVDGWSDVFVDPTNDDDDWSTDTDHELVIDEDRASSLRTEDILTDEDLDECDKTVKPKSIERVFKTKTAKEKDKREKETKSKKQTLEPSIPEKLIKPKTILSDKQALAASIPDKIIEPKSIKRVSKTKLTEKRAFKPSILEKLLETKTNLSDKQALATYSNPKKKLKDPKTKGTITILSDKRIPAASIPEKLVEPKTTFSHKQALVESCPGKLTGPKSIEQDYKTKLSDKQALKSSILEKLLEPKTNLSDKQALAAYSITNKLIDSKSIGRVSKTIPPKTKGTITILSDKLIPAASIPEKLVEPKTTFLHKIGLAESCPGKLTGPKSIEQDYKTKLSDKQALKSSILEKLLEPKTNLSDKQALAAHSITNKLIQPKSIGRVSKTMTHKTKETKTKLSLKRAPAASIPEKLVESKTKLSDKQALPSILIIYKPDELAESKTIMSNKQALRSIPEKIVEETSIEQVSKPEMLSVKEKRANAIEQKQALAVDAATLFEFSNATAFKNKNRNGYPCFYCREVYKYNRLKQHQEDKHAAAKGSIYTLLSKYHAADFVVYAEITDLKCTICKKDIKDLYELREHLSKKHGKNMHKIPDRVIPFKLQEKDFECQICGRIFETFGLVERHMNTHFGTFVCQTCGTPFITKHRLAVHRYSLHKNAKEKCKVCKKSFATYLKMRIHYEAVHKKNKTILCSKCPEKFLNYFSRIQHLAEAHGVARHLYQCKECEKGFAQRSYLNDHENRCHMQEIDKKIKCDKCSFECYTKSELCNHKLIHSHQEFECDICKKVYNRRRSLAIHFRVHMTRV